MTVPLQEDEAARLHGVLMAAFRCVTPPGEATYVSTPITTGPRFVAWRRDHPDEEVGSARYREVLLRNVIEPNIADAQPLVARARQHFAGVVIDPTMLEDIPGWEQLHYHRFWTEVITRFAARVVFGEGWAYSIGCLLELAAASTAGYELLDHRFEPLDLTVAIRAACVAVEELRGVGAETDRLVAVIEEMRDRATVGH